MKNINEKYIEKNKISNTKTKVKNINTERIKQDILQSNIQERLKVRMIIDPSVRRMSITYNYNNIIQTQTISTNSQKDWPTNLIKIQHKITTKLLKIKCIECGGQENPTILEGKKTVIERSDCGGIDLELYIEKPRIAQRYMGKIVEKGYAYRIHWVIGALLSMLSILKNINITKVVLVPANRWYFGLKLTKGKSEKRKFYSIEHAEEIVKEYNIEVEKIKGDEADSINMWYWLKENNWEIETKKQNNKIKILEERSKMDKELKEKLRELLKK